MNEHIGALIGTGLRIGIVVARFNEIITKSLLSGSLDALKRHGVQDHDISIAWVPGAFEIPLAAQTMAGTGCYDAIICLGAVIRGSTPHFDYVAGQAASGISKAALDAGIPMMFGVLTTDTVEQAIERAGTKCGNKGYDVAVGAIEMIDLIRSLKKPKNAASTHQVKLQSAAQSQHS